jgi:midasin
MIEEVKHVYKPLEEFSLKILEYLAEWPENPLLLSLLKIVHRIVSFSVTTPLIQILTGLEILLKKGYEWEGYASKRVSVQGTPINLP